VQRRTIEKGKEIAEVGGLGEKRKGENEVGEKQKFFLLVNCSPWQGETGGESREKEENGK